MKLWWISLLSAPLVFGHAAVAAPQGGELGKLEYLNSCASCHGPEGRGDGPVAKSLKRTPADLTKLSQANKGVFPFSRIYDVIDGRFEVETHGKREMPVWGQLYQPTIPWGSAQTTITTPYLSTALGELFVRARILALVEYISTLQGK
jgi:mono/diheme cytochrome c family protein